MPRKRKETVQQESAPVLAVNMVCQNCHHIVATMFTVSGDGMRQVVGASGDVPRETYSGEQVAETMKKRHEARMKDVAEKRDNMKVTRVRDSDLRHPRYNP